MRKEIKMYNKYKIKIKFRDKIYGGLPLLPEVLESYIGAKIKPTDDFAKKLNRKDNLNS